MSDNTEATQPKVARTRKFSFKAVMDERLLAAPKLTNVCVLELRDKRNIPKVLSILPRLPPSLTHLKRINDTAVIVHGLEEPPNGEVRAKIEQIDGEGPQFLVKSVVSSKPKTKAQFEIAKQHWPTSFHENKHLEALLDNTAIHEEEAQRLGEVFAKAESIEGCVFYDSGRNRVVTEHSGNARRPLKHPVMRAVEELAARQRLNDDDDEQHLANGLDVFLASEPCTVCAMALVHCRAKRVFFGALRPSYGALSSRWCLQHNPSINHHYQVFQVTESLS